VGQFESGILSAGKRKMGFAMLRRTFIVALILCALGAAPCGGQDTFQQEADRLATLLKWHPGDALAEVGAGNGKLTLATAQRIGTSGKVYTTELDPKALAHLEELAAKDRSITAVKAAETDTNLPSECCDSIFMRLVYHHLTRPAEIDASLFRSLKPEGRLAVIDEEPREGTSIPEGVPKNRGGHGIPQKILISELTAAGFQVETITNDWPSRDEFHQIYCVVFRKTKTKP
jgi:ubiquinone/menaquinone biosynthesis C-methylase UbiE